LVRGRFTGPADHRHRRRIAVRPLRRTGLAVAPSRRRQPHAADERARGIAGSFVGYHLALVIGILGYGALIVAIIVALAVLWAWRTVR
jgi:hypothetical protein